VSGDSMNGGGGMTEDELTPTKRLIRRLLNVLEITRVINVDDDHVGGSQESREEVIGALRAGTLDPGQVARFLLSDGGESEVVSVEDAIGVLDQNWEKIKSGSRVELTLAASRATGEEAGKRAEEAASNNAALLTLPDLLGDDIQFVRMGLVEWRESGHRLLNDQTKTLLLVDRSFENEGQSATAGDDILRGVLARDDRSHVFVGLLTHTASDDGRERAIAAEILGNQQLARPPIVIAKKRLLTDSFPEALRVLLFAEEVEDFRQHAMQSLQAATLKGVDFLRQVDRYALLASFEAARTEGVFETDFAMRMPSTVMRKNLASALREPKFLDGPLKSLRDAAGIDVYFDGAKRPKQISSIEWEERFDDAEYLAKLALPVEVGDVFRMYDPYGSGADRYYVLLVQACDLTVRGDGRRSNDPRSLGLTHVRRAAIDDDGKIRPIKANQAELGNLIPGESGIWRVEFSRQLQVPALALDACVISGTGKSVIAVNADAPSSLPSSWMRRLGHMKQWAASVIDKYENLEQGISGKGSKRDREEELRGHLAASLLDTEARYRDGLMARIIPSDRSIEFYIERYARISDHTAHGLFSLLVNHQARPAFNAPMFLNPEDRK
jgi:hypothetical protein